jgi:hypothetical protein
MLDISGGTSFPEESTRGKVCSEDPQRASRKSTIRHVAAAVRQPPRAQDGLIAFVSDAPAKRQQVVELRGIVTDSVGSRDEDLPALLCKGARLGDRDDSA